MKSNEKSQVFKMQSNVSTIQDFEAALLADLQDEDDKRSMKYSLMAQDTRNLYTEQNKEMSKWKSDIETAAKDLSMHEKEEEENLDHQKNKRMPQIAQSTPSKRMPAHSQTENAYSSRKIQSGIKRPTSPGRVSQMSHIHRSYAPQTLESLINYLEDGRRKREMSMSRAEDREVLSLINQMKLRGVSLTAEQIRQITRTIDNMQNDLLQRHSKAIRGIATYLEESSKGL